jgi:hypothetical protein
MSQVDVTNEDANPELLRPPGVRIPTQEGDNVPWLGGTLQVHHEQNAVLGVTDSTCRWRTLMWRWILVMMTNPQDMHIVGIQFPLWGLMSPGSGLRVIFRSIRIRILLTGNSNRSTNRHTNTIL